MASQHLQQIYDQWLPVVPLPADATLQGKTAIVTGSTSGLGFEVAKHLAAIKPQKLILTGRTSSRMAAPYDKIMDSADTRNVVPWQLDLNSNASIVAFAERVKQHGRLDLLILSASILESAWKEAEGHELNLQTNIYGSFLLAFLLLPLLRKTNGRIIVVSSGAAAVCPTPPPYLTLTELDSFERTTAAARSADPPTLSLSLANRYPLTKLLQILLTRSIADKLQDASIVAVNPGMGAPTSLYRNLRGFEWLSVYVLGLTIARRARDAALVLLYPAFLPAETPINGRYFSNCKQTELPFVVSEPGKALGDRLLQELIDQLSKVDKRVLDAFK